jgi:hypothetical protein
MEPTLANGQPAVRAYLFGDPMGIAVLDCRTDGIAVFAGVGREVAARASAMVSASVLVRRMV